MSVLSAQTIRRMCLLTPCDPPTVDDHGRTRGLSACGYDLTLDQDLIIGPGDFRLCSAAEHFCLPNNVLGRVHDKSSLARLGLAVQNTVAEPGWRGFLTLEVTNHGMSSFHIFRGSAIAQVIFEFLDEPTYYPYAGKYQDQRRGPQESIPTIPRRARR